jgi:hypothetical protein
MNYEVRCGDEENSKLEVFGEHFPQCRIERHAGGTTHGLSSGTCLRELLGLSVRLVLGGPATVILTWNHWYASVPNR